MLAVGLLDCCTSPGLGCGLLALGALLVTEAAVEFEVGLLEATGVEVGAAVIVCSAAVLLLGLLLVLVAVVMDGLVSVGAAGAEATEVSGVGLDTTVGAVCNLCCCNA